MSCWHPRASVEKEFVGEGLIYFWPTRSTRKDSTPSTSAATGVEPRVQPHHPLSAGISVVATLPCTGHLLETLTQRTRPVVSFAHNRRASATPQAIAVGMHVTVHPPHRSRRAAFPHRAPTLGDGQASVGWARDG